MSDFITTLTNDKARETANELLRKAEIDFRDSPDATKAIQLAIWWSTYIILPSGYWGKVGSDKAYERINFYAHWSPGDCPIPPGAPTDGEVVVSLGPGTAKLSEQLAEEIEEQIRTKLKGSISHSVLKVKMEVVTVARMSCLECPMMTSVCSERLCANYDERRWRQRQSNIKEGRRTHEWVQAKILEGTISGTRLSDSIENSKTENA